MARPILFSGPMVRAILAGRKTVTRRIVDGVVESGGTYSKEAWERGEMPRCPYGEPGDRLWLRETWRYHGWTEDGAPWIKYAADDSTRLVERIPDEWSDRLADIWADLSDDANMAIDGRAADRKWRPSIFLPRWASRITLEVVGVRVERLQEITENDARAEGVNPSDAHIVIKDGDRQHDMERTHRGAFACLWDGINGDRAPWASNPWVWRVEFRRVQP